MASTLNFFKQSPFDLLKQALNLAPYTEGEVRTAASAIIAKIQKQFDDKKTDFSDVVFVAQNFQSDLGAKGAHPIPGSECAAAIFARVYAHFADKGAKTIIATMDNRAESKAFAKAPTDAGAKVYTENRKGKVTAERTLALPYCVTGTAGALPMEEVQRVAGFAARRALGSEDTASEAIKAAFADHNLKPKFVFLAGAGAEVAEAAIDLQWARGGMISGAKKADYQVVYVSGMVADKGPVVAADILKNKSVAVI